MSEDAQTSSKRGRESTTPERDHEVRSKRMKVSYKSGDRVKAKWPGSVNDRHWPGTMLRDTNDLCLIKFDHGNEIHTVQNINVQRLLPSEEKVRAHLFGRNCM